MKGATNDRTTPTVFIVDDEPSVRKAVERLIRSAGLEAMTFGSPEAFLNAYSPNAHGCIVLDVAMPGISGLELQQALARDGAAPPIIFLSGRGDIPMTVRAMKQGAVDFLTKPIDGDELLKTVRLAIDRDLSAWTSRIEQAERRKLLATLTAREREVLAHVISGSSTSRRLQILAPPRKRSKFTAPASCES
jgi:FixJ family two-component response regulator